MQAEESGRKLLGALNYKWALPGTGTGRVNLLESQILLGDKA